LKVTIKKPHIEEHHVKHSAGIGIVLGTVLEAAHMFYPSGLIMLGIAGCIAVYEPYVVKTFNGDFGHDEED